MEWGVRGLGGKYGGSMGVDGFIHGEWIFELYHVNTVKLQSAHSRYHL